jgi:hypothetical protein
MAQDKALTVAEVIAQETRGIRWSQQAIDRALQNIHLATRDLPDATEYAILRRQVARLQQRLRDTHGMLNAVIEAAGAAKVAAVESPIVYVKDKRLLVRRESSQNGADKVARARKEREQREETFAERQRYEREVERRAWLALRDAERREREEGGAK